MTGGQQECQRAHLRSLIFLLLLHERPARQLYGVQIADRLDRAPDSLRVVLREAERCGLVESRLETLSEVEARNLTGYSGASRRRLYWLTDRADLDVVQDRGRAIRRALLSMLLVLAWPGALITAALYQTPHGYAAVRWFVFGERPEESMRS